MAEGDFVRFALEAFALVVSLELWIVLTGAKGGLEEGGAQGFDAALAHLGLSFPLAAFLQPRVIAHEGLESSGNFAITSGVEDLAGQVSQDFGSRGRTKAGH